MACSFRMSVCLGMTAQGLFLDTFNEGRLEGGSHLTGDGRATLRIEPHDGYLSVFVDAAADRQNIGAGASRLYFHFRQGD